MLFGSVLRLSFLKHILFVTLFAFLLFFPLFALASDNNNPLDFNLISAYIVENLGPITRLMTGFSYVLGIGFSFIALINFKRHKDNPQQVPLATPIFQIFIAAALIWFPLMFGAIGTSMFGTTDNVAGPEGVSNIWHRNSSNQ